MQRLYIPLNVAAPELLDADVLSYTIPRAWWRQALDPLSKAIAVAGRGEEYHTGMVCKDNGHIVALGMRFRAQKLKLLVDEVTDNPRRIDVWRHSGSARFHGRYPWQAHGLSRETRRLIVNEVRRFALHDHYGWVGVTLAAGNFVPFVRWLVRPHSDKIEDMKRPPFCSDATSRAFRKYVGPLLNNRADAQMLPTDVISSTIMSYLFTLDVPSDSPMPIEWYWEQVHGKAVRRAA